jgi:hypothetical protein
MSFVPGEGAVVTDDDVRHLLDLQPYGCADPDCELCAAFFGSATSTDQGNESKRAETALDGL